MITAIINKIIKITYLLDSCMTIYMCVNLNNKNYMNQENTDIENQKNKNTDIENQDINKKNITPITNKRRVSFSNTFKYKSTKKNIPRQPTCNILDSIFMCNYCNRTCTLEIYRFMDNSYCSKFCRNQIIPHD